MKSEAKKIFSIPLRWEKSFIDDVLMCETNNGVFEDFYGCIDFDKMNNGRVPLDFQNVNISQARKIVEHIHKCDRRVKYLLNAPNPSDNSHDHLDNVIKVVLNELGVDAIVVSSLSVMEKIRNYSPDIEIHISTIGRVSSPIDLERYTPINPSRLVPQHDIPKKPKALRGLLDACNQKEITIEIMVTESCLFECPWMEDHYQTLADGNNDREYHRNCRERRINSPFHLLASGSFFRPQDLWIFQEMGINHFKISGRSKPKKWLLRAATAYCNGIYHGNLVNLMGMDPSVVPEQWMHLASESLDDFVQTLYKDNHENPIQLAKEYSARLQESDLMTIADYPYK